MMMFLLWMCWRLRVMLSSGGESESGVDFSELSEGEAFDVIKSRILEDAFGGDVKARELVMRHLGGKYLKDDDVSSLDVLASKGDVELLVELLVGVRGLMVVVGVDGELVGVVDGLLESVGGLL